MQRIFYCGLVLLLWSCLVQSASPSVYPYENLGQGYEIFWVNSTVVRAAFLLTTDRVTGYHKLYRSVDEGLSWAATSLPQVGTVCFVVRIYQNPNMPEQLLFSGPPESECGFTTIDAGVNFKAVKLPTLHHVSFNPTIPGWVIGMTPDSKIYISNDDLTQWSLIPGATRAEWILTADESDTVPYLSIYMIKDNVFGYSTDYGKTFNPLLGDAVELYKTRNFIYVLSQNRTLTVGFNKENLFTSHFPFGSTVPYVFTVSDDVSGATWFYTDASYYWGNVYTADIHGGLYIEAQDHVLKRDDAFLDIHSVRGLPGVHLLNKVINYNDYRNLLLKTYITFDNGGEWAPLKTPGVACPTCSLNLYFNYKSTQRPMYTSSNTIGLLIANGAVGPSLPYDNSYNLNTYISRDAGLTWQQVSVPAVTGPYVFQVGSNGGILVVAPQNKLTNSIYYSLDQGLTFSTQTLLSTTPVFITSIETSVTGNSTAFVLFASNVVGDPLIFGVDFSTILPRSCVSGSADYEEWAPSDGVDDGCWLGQKVLYSRRARSAACADIRGEQIVSSSVCDCTIEDYECDFGFTSDNRSCILTGTLPPSPPAHCHKTYSQTSGFRQVPGTKCQGGIQKGPVLVDCPRGSDTKGSSNAWVAVVVILVVVIVLGLAAFIIYRDPALREKVASFLRISKSSNSRYSRVGGRGNSLAGEEDFGIHDDLLEDGGEEEDAKVLHDNDISKASSRGDELFSSRHDDDN